MKCSCVNVVPVLFIEWDCNYPLSLDPNIDKTLMLLRQTLDSIRVVVILNSPWPMSRIRWLIRKGFYTTLIFTDSNIFDQPTVSFYLTQLSLKNKANVVGSLNIY